MEARSVHRIPADAGWLYEPKWDGFRCIAFRDGPDVMLQSKSGQPLERYFPEIVAALQSFRAQQFVLDGELAVQRDERLDFDALLQRIHPAASRIRKLSVETPAGYYVFDLLVEGSHSIFERPLERRRGALEDFSAEQLSQGCGVALSPATQNPIQAESWLAKGARWFDGVIAKRSESAYRFGERDAVVKIKRVHTADCVVGGFRLTKDTSTIASLLLGLYDDANLLHLVGFIGSLTQAERERAAQMLKPLVAEPGFTGARPGGVSRWGTRDAQWYPVQSRVVVEVQFDHVTGTRFRHGARFVRWRPDKNPAQCTMEQLLAAR